MPSEPPSKYGDALTGSDWPGLPLRIGYIPESGTLADLSSDVDSVLVWAGGPSTVRVVYVATESSELREHCFERGSGMVDLLPRGTVLREVCWEGKPSVCVSINLPPRSLGALGVESRLGLDPTQGPRFGLIDAHLVDLGQRLRAQAEGPEFWGALYVQSLSLALASYVSRRYGQGLPELSARSALLSLAQRRKLETFIDQRISGNFGLVELASLVGYSPDHFSRLFKKTYEESPHQYILSRRIERAKAMLRDEGVSIAEAAIACGFSSQGHLTTVFKQRTGITPGSFRDG